MAWVIGAVPVLLALEMMPVAKPLEQGFLVLVAVPLPKGAPVLTGMGTTETLLKTTPGSLLAAWSTPPRLVAILEGVAV